MWLLECSIVTYRQHCHRFYIFFSIFLVRIIGCFLLKWVIVLISIFKKMHTKKSIFRVELQMNTPILDFIFRISYNFVRDQIIWLFLVLFCAWKLDSVSLSIVATMIWNKFAWISTILISSMIKLRKPCWKMLSDYIKKFTSKSYSHKFLFLIFKKKYYF